MPERRCMPKPEILPSPPASIPAAWVFDTCQLGVVLRAVLAVQLVMGLASAYTEHQGADWLLHTAWLTSGGLSATLAWLMLTCACKRILQRLPPQGQYGVGLALGAVCSLYASAMLALTGSISSIHWWANAVLGALLAGAMMGWLVLRAQARTPAATTAQLALLQARIRPHFLFNALNSAIALVRAEPHKAERLLEDLSDLFRAALQEQGATVPLEQEMELAKRYIYIEQVRFGERMQVRWDIDSNILHAAVPPLLLQPLVENAVKHGVETAQEGTHIRISAHRHGTAYMLITVTNTLGTSHPPSPGLGMALDNVRHRLQLLYDIDYQLQLRRKANAFQVRLRLPLLPVVPVPALAPLA